MKIYVVPVGGRIKSASVGLDIFAPGNENFQAQMKRTRENPPIELLNAFFPSDAARLKQMMRGVGFYRPILKTDQGMGGNFLPFYIDLSIRGTDLSVRKIVKEEGLTIPEMYLKHSPSVLQEMREVFKNLDLQNTYRVIEPLLAQSREAEKGRTPFFFIRPALLSSPIVFGNDIVQKVTDAVEQLFSKLGDSAIQQFPGLAMFWDMFSTREQDPTYAKNTKLYPTVQYLLADVFITTKGEVVVEKLQLPDVGFFLTQLNLDGSIALETQKMANQIQHHVFKRLLDVMQPRVICTTHYDYGPLKGKTIKEMSPSVAYIITRDEVLQKSEDVLEILEIQSIVRKFHDAGVATKVKGISQLEDIPIGGNCFLMNLDYSTDTLKRLEKSGMMGDFGLSYYPSPYLQIVSSDLTGLKETKILRNHIEKFFRLIDCNPMDGVAAERVILQVDGILSRHGVTADLLHLVINGKEIVPVHRRIHHSWKQLVKRVRQHQGEGRLEDVILKIRELPITSQNSLITSDTGSRVHSFRFTFTV